MTFIKVPIKENPTVKRNQRIDLTILVLLKNVCNYSDPLCYVENLLIIGGYKDDFNGFRDSLICA